MSRDVLRPAPPVDEALGVPVDDDRPELDVVPRCCLLLRAGGVCRMPNALLAEGVATSSLEGPFVEVSVAVVVAVDISEGDELGVEFKLDVALDLVVTISLALMRYY